MAIKTRQTTATGVTNNNAPLTNAELDNNFVELQQNKVDASGDTMTGDLDFGDNVQIRMGASNDLRMYHQGTYSIIQENGTGTFWILGSDMRFANSGFTENYIDCVENGHVRLYHDSSPRLETSSTGVDITGEVKADKFTNDEALPEQKPTVLLDFANSGSVGPKARVQRYGRATYFDGTRITDAENQFNYSYNLHDYWNYNRATLTAVTAPDGTTTATKAVPTTASDSHDLWNYCRVVPDDVYTFSVFALADGYDFITLSHAADASNWASAKFDLSDGSVVFKTKQGSFEEPIKAEVHEFHTFASDTWYRLSITVRAVRNSGSPYDAYCLIGVANDDSSISGGYYGRDPFVGNGTDGIKVWGAQMEKSNFARGYMPTQGSGNQSRVSLMKTAGSQVARIEVDPSTGEKKGLLLEEASTNHVLNSALWPNRPFSYTSGNPYVYHNACIAPDGTLTANQIFGGSVCNFNAGGGIAPAVTSGTVYRASVFIRHWSGAFGNDNTMSIYFGEGNSTNGKQVVLSVNETTHAVTTSTSDSSVEHVGGDWYRVKTEYTSGSTTNHTMTFGGLGNNSIWSFWGPQWETGGAGNHTSYIKTDAGATVTRDDDQVHYDFANFEFANADALTIFAEFSSRELEYTGARIFQLSDGTGDNRFDGFINTQIQIYMRSEADTDVSGGGSAYTYPLNTMTKAAWKGTEGDFAISYDGSVQYSSTSNNFPYGMDRLTFGFNESGQGHNGYIKSFSLWDRAYSNAILNNYSEQD